MIDTIYSKNCVKQDFFAKIREFGIAKTARRSGELLVTIERWLYDGVEPRLDKAVNVLNAIGYTLSVSSVEELASEIKQFGTTALHKKSGISKSTLRSYLYVGKMPTLGSVEQIMQAIGKPLKIVKAINKVWAGCLYRKCAQVDADTVIRCDDIEVYVKAIGKPLYEDKQ